MKRLAIIWFSALSLPAVAADLNIKGSALGDGIEKMSLLGACKVATRGMCIGDL